MITTERWALIFDVEIQAFPEANATNVWTKAIFQICSFKKSVCVSLYVTFMR